MTVMMAETSAVRLMAIFLVRAVMARENTGRNDNAPSEDEALRALRDYIQTMGTFLGCCLVAAVLWYVGRKIARALFAIGVMLENIGGRQYDDWPSDEQWKDAFK